MWNELVSAYGDYATYDEITDRLIERFYGMFRLQNDLRAFESGRRRILQSIHLHR